MKKDILKKVLEKAKKASSTPKSIYNKHAAGEYKGRIVKRPNYEIA